MTLAIFYFLAIMFGYTLMYLYRKYFEKKQVYYISWIVFIVILNSIAPIMNESLFFLFELDNYDNISPFVQFIFFIFLLIPTIFLAFPFLKIGSWLYDTLSEFFESLMLLFVPKKRKDDYYSSKDIGS
jgi:hypothetical protein